MKNLTMKMKSVIIKIVKTYKDSMSCNGEGMLNGRGYTCAQRLKRMIKQSRLVFSSRLCSFMSLYLAAEDRGNSHVRKISDLRQNNVQSDAD